MEPSVAPKPEKAVVRIVGTSHVAKDSERAIKKAFDEMQPDIIGVELDHQRLHALLHPQPSRMPISMVRELGVTGYLFALIGRTAQQRIGEALGVKPGLDMLYAVNLAKEHKKKVALVDQDLRITLRRLSKQFTFKEKMRVVGDIVLGPFSKKHQINLAKIPEKELVATLVGILKKRYPSLYRTLIVERNAFMCSKLDAIARKEPGTKVLLIVGAGHEEDLRERLQKSATITLL
jgi:pheromone shutdown-related protein TraB